jgi:CubicO group peptidase (beta-lactamase class C family)
VTTQLRERLSAHVERGDVPGLVALISRGGDVQVEVLGAKASGSQDPMRRDTLFRISSMTKPVTAAAAMTLVDDGTLDLDEPVEKRWLPELANRRVLTRLDAPLEDTVPAKRSITARDLLTFTFGFGILLPFDGYPITRAAEALHLGAFGPPRPQEPPAPDEWIRRFATLPLMRQPGEVWLYNTGSEVLSVLLARAAGKPLDALLRERLFEPLGMKDTAFAAPPEKLHRMAAGYLTDPQTGALQPYDPVEGGQWSRPPAFPSGAAGLVSTADDFLAFGQMLLNRGTLGRARILSPESVDAMTADHLTPAQKAAASFPPFGFWKNHGWGFGVCQVTAPDDLTGAAGRYGWDGGMGTAWANDPGRQLVAILMTQRGAFPLFSQVYRDFFATVYGVAPTPPPIPPAR